MQSSNPWRQHYEFGCGGAYNQSRSDLAVSFRLGSPAIEKAEDIPLYSPLSVAGEFSFANSAIEEIVR